MAKKAKKAKTRRKVEPKKAKPKPVEVQAAPVSHLNEHGQRVKLDSALAVLGDIANWPIGKRSDDAQAMAELARAAVERFK